MLTPNQENMCIVIAEWIITTEKLREITKYLYEHTELFERKYLINFSEKLWNFFAGKITRSSKDINQLYNLLTDEEKRKIQLYKLMK